jgi:lipopolysaccharide export LptBFGC system permease protein LptF
MPGCVSHQRTTISIVFTSAIRVLFTTLLFTAAGMGAGLFCGIVGTVIYGIIRGTQVDMSDAYKHVAIPAAIIIGSAAFAGALVLEVRHRQRTSL